MWLLMPLLFVGFHSGAIRAILCPAIICGGLIRNLWYNMEAEKIYTSAFDVKLIVFGDYFEVYKYSKPQITNRKRIVIEKKTKIMDEEKKTRFQYSLNRTRNTVRRLVSANFHNRDRFVTLTFAENLQDVRIANTCFKQFIRYIRHYLISQGEFKIEDFKYLAVIEFQKRGAIHYHLMMKAPFLPDDILQIAWPYGFFKVNVTEHVENIGAYISKYLYKDVSDPRLRGKRAYQTSRNLLRPFEITEKHSVREFLSNVKPISRVLKKSTFDNEFTGRVYYRQYKRTEKGTMI